MRKCNEIIRRAFEAKRSARSTNRVTDGYKVWLFDTRIIWYAAADSSSKKWAQVVSKTFVADQGECIEFTLAGWPTRTTIQTLNDILGLGLHTRQGTLYFFDGTEVDPNEVYKL